MGASNRHGGQKISRKLKVLFAKNPARHSVFRNYFIKSNKSGEGVPSASAAAAPAQTAKESQ